MPTYDYRCPDGHEFEHFFRKISDAKAELPCPECGKVATRQLSGGAGLVFKGSGFYLTDYGKNAHRKGGSPKAGGESSGGESSGGESKASDKKPGDAKASDAKPTSGTSETKASPSTSSTPKSGGGASEK